MPWCLGRLVALQQADREGTSGLACVACYRMQKGIALVGLCPFLKLIRSKAERILDEDFDESVHDCKLLVELLPRHHPGKLPSPGDDALDVLHVVERVRKGGLAVLHAIHTAAEQKIGGCVQGESEEDVQDING